MIKTSIFVSFFLTLYGFLKNSVLYSLLQKTIDFFAGAFSGTFFMKCMKCAGKEFKREGSVFYNLINKICILFFSFTQKIYTAAQGGMVYKGISRLFKSSKIFHHENFLLFGLFAIFLFPHEVWNNAFALIFALFCVLLYFLAAARGKKIGKNARRIWCPFVLFAGAVLLSVLISADVADSIRVLMFFAVSFILCLITFGVLADERKFDRMCAMVFWSLVFTGAIALCQKVLGVEVDALLTDTNLNGNMPGRVFSTWANPNNFAEFIIIFFCQNIIRIIRHDTFCHNFIFSVNTL